MFLSLYNVKYTFSSFSMGHFFLICNSEMKTQKKLSKRVINHYEDQLVSFIDIEFTIYL